VAANSAPSISGDSSAFIVALLVKAMRRGAGGTAGDISWQGGSE
jgi:hypothetical protein